MTASVLEQMMSNEDDEDDDDDNDSDTEEDDPSFKITLIYLFVKVAMKLLLEGTILLAKIRSLANFAKLNTR